MGSGGSGAGWRRTASSGTAARRQRYPGRGDRLRRALWRASASRLWALSSHASTTEARLVGILCASTACASLSQNLRYSTQQHPPPRLRRQCALFLCFFPASDALTAAVRVPVRPSFSTRPAHYCPYLPHGLPLADHDWPLVDQTSCARTEHRPLGPTPEDAHQSTPASRRVVPTSVQRSSATRSRG